MPPGRSATAQPWVHAAAKLPSYVVSFPSFSGGGSCTTWNGSLTSERINYDTDYVNPSGHCGSLAASTYSAGSCSSTGVQGRCSGYLAGGGGAGPTSVLGYTVDFATDGDLQTWCNTALGSSNYVYNAL